ncbi:sulfur-oxidizing protein SoxA [Bosea sp. OK403]|uniref:hypothetical protein n=1 Tax=Bosea sp. OK403 TaxID=1855286 RepID=UPI0008F2F98E|nr:hypothetical protein [Bosea sp. OK403]SFJ44930.1 sulfur-oxidizing protein SoxA [Bosea sp. OK403]
MSAARVTIRAALAASQHRSLRACSLEARATSFDLGAPEYRAPELFLAPRVKGLPVEMPGIRR